MGVKFGDPRLSWRFWNKVEAQDDGCWLWTGASNGNGYGVLTRNKEQWYAHRLSYTVLVGEIPEGLVIDHLCRVRGCVNPRCLEAVTYRENTRRGKSTAPLTGSACDDPSLTSYTQGCRCDDCRRAVSEQGLEYKRYRRAGHPRKRGAPRIDPDCGEPSSRAYGRGCRCAGCRAARAEYQRNYMKGYRTRKAAQGKGANGLVH